MKAKLKFNLDDLDDRQSFLRCVKSLDMASALSDICHMRKGVEWQFENVSNENNDVFDGIDACFSKISEILEKNSIDIDDLIS